MPSTMRLHVVRDARPESRKVPFLLKLFEASDATGKRKGRDSAI